jgi:hypothetical protein
MSKRLSADVAIARLTADASSAKGASSMLAFSKSPGMVLPTPGFNERVPSALILCSL